MFARPWPALGRHNLGRSHVRVPARNCFGVLFAERA
jgi:hypothetical protein